MFKSGFGIEIEFTGITRSQAANVIAQHYDTVASNIGGYYDAYTVTDDKGRSWKVMSDGSIKREQKLRGQIVCAGGDYSVEVVSPVLHYEDDMTTLQEIVRELRHAGGFANDSCGIHVHLDGAGHTAKTLKNYINIIASHNDLLYNALDIAPDRQRYCKALDADLVARVNSQKALTLNKLADIWYTGYDGYGSRTTHYNSSRYHFLNLHSYFNGNNTVELRGFNSTLHAGKVRSYVVLALAINDQALKQNRASTKKTQNANEKFAMRTWLNRLGLIGDEYAACREHLTANLAGCAAWRFGNDHAA